MPLSPWPFLSEGEAIAAAGILTTIALAMLGYLGRRLYTAGQRKSLVAHLGLELLSNTRITEQLIGTKVSREAWADHHVRGLFDTEDSVTIAVAYALGDTYNEHCGRAAAAHNPERGHIEGTALREAAAAAHKAFNDAGRTLEKYGWPSKHKF